jgi:hypothetical protein
VKPQRYILRDENIRENLIRFIGQLDLETPKEVCIEDHKVRRSLNQNALYHKWITLLKAKTGYTHKELHWHLAMEILGPVEVTIGGKTREQPRSTADLSKVQFSEYLEQVQCFAAQELGVMLPWPDEEWAA